MKIRPIYWVALGLVLALTVAVCDGLRTRNAYSVAMKNEKDSNKKLVAEKDKIIIAARATIILQTAKIAELLGNAGKPSETEIAQDKIIAEQKKEIAKFKAKGDYKVALEAAEVEVRAWVEKFTLAEERYKTELFDLNAAWAAKFDAQVTISESWKQKYEGELHLRMLAEKGWKASENKLRWTRVMSNIKSGLIVGALGYIGYSALKGTSK